MSFTELNENSQWYCYCILGKVKSKAESMHYLNNWMKIYQILDEFLQDCPQKYITSEQLKETILKIGKDGYPNTTHKKAPTGGKLKWNEQNNRKICTLYLQEQLEEIIEVEKTGKDYYDLRIEQFPIRNTWIDFDGNTVEGYLGTDDNTKKKKNVFPDFMLTLSPTFNPNKATKVNFETQIYISERYTLRKGMDKVDEFIKQFLKVTNIVKIGVTKTPFCKRYVDKNGSNFLRVYVGCNFADRETLAYSKIGIENWETIYKK